MNENGPERERAILLKILQLVQPLEELLSAEADLPRLKRTVSPARGLANAPDLPATSVAKQTLRIGEMRGNVRLGHFGRVSVRPSVRPSVVPMVFAGSYRESRGSPSNGTESAFAYRPKSRRR